MTPGAVVIGIGNPYRRDDGVGPAVIELLRQRGLTGVTLVESDGEAAALIALWDRRPLAVLIDGIRTVPPHPGRVHRFVLPRLALERDHVGNSHAVALGDAVALAAELHRVPGRMLLFGVETADTAFGTGLSTPVAAAAAHVADEIAELVRTHTGDASTPR